MVIMYQKHVVKISQYVVISERLLLTVLEINPKSSLKDDEIQEFYERVKEGLEKHKA